MKLKDVNLNIPHYVVAINTMTSHILVAKTMYSILEKSNYPSVADEFFIYPHLQDKIHTWINQLYQ